LQIKAVEQFGVHDGLKIGGTWDRIVTWQGRDYIADIKTGSIQYGVHKIAMQLGVYSRCSVYGPPPQRTPLQVDQDRALIIHLPAGTGQCELVWVNIAQGWADVDICRQVREARGRKNLTQPFTVGFDLVTELHVVADEHKVTKAEALAQQIEAAGDEATLHSLKSRYAADWTQEHSELANARWALLAAGVVA
jgi:hypothetical protein